jgi:hypothetical protein
MPMQSVLCLARVVVFSGCLAVNCAVEKGRLEASDFLIISKLKKTNL